MTKQEFLVISNLLVKHGFDELDRLEFVMCFERETKSIIPDEWLAEASLSKPEETVDLDAFRMTAAKDILCAIISSDTAGAYDEKCGMAVTISNELIRQLKVEKKGRR